MEQLITGSTVTFTYDVSLFEPQHIRRLVDLYLGQIELAHRALQ